MALRLLRDLRVRDGTSIDLSALTWITPAMMVGVAALAHRAADMDTDLCVVGPARDDIAAYVARMRLGRVLSRLQIRHDISTESRERNRRNDLLEVRAVASEADAHKLAGLVHRNLATTSPGMANALFDCLAEVGANVADHSRATGYMAAQKIPSRNELHIAVADGGVGLLHWLAPSLGARDDAEALDFALAGRSRFTEEIDRGGGIARAVDLVAAATGTATLASGSAWARVHRGGRTGGTTRHPYDGTIFDARIPLRPHAAGEVP